MQTKHMTALVSCFARAYHAKQNCVKIFDDLLAERMLAKEEYESIGDNMANGIAFFHPGFQGTKKEALRYIVDRQLSPAVLGRGAFAERSLANAKRRGASQYLILASGYDTSAYRNTDVKVFEIDRKEMIEDKKRRLKRAGMDATGVRFICADFTEEKWIAALLEESDYQTDQVCFCSLLGLSYYLTKDDFAGMLKSLSDVMQSGSELVFDYPTAEKTTYGTINRELAKAADEEMKSQYALQDIERLLGACNMRVCENLDDRDMEEQYFAAYNLANPAHPIKAPHGVSYCRATKE